MRKTKILATLGPASDDLETIEKLMLAGMNGVRINFSHGTYETHTEIIEKVKKAREKLNLPIPLILDTQGPEIRIKTFAENKVYLTKDEKFTLTTRDVEGDNSIVSVTYQDLPKDVKKGDRVLIDDGLIELTVMEITDTDIECIVANGGFISSRKGVNVPDVYVNLPSLTQKDIKDIEFGISMGFDFIAASFVRSAGDILAVKSVLEGKNALDIEIIAKIENRDGVNNIDEILEISGGIMVARGDLGVEIPPWEVPVVQKMLISKANKRGKPVITATQMLESMVLNPRPTRAEANDVANAIFDGSDTIMLSGETAAGAYPVEAVMMMSSIAETAEDSVDYSGARLRKPKITTVTNAISHSACTTAAELNASCITTVTKSGFTARMISKFRPKCPIVATTTEESVWRKLNLVWGCIPTWTKELPGDQNVFGIAVEHALESGVAKNGDMIVICSGLPVGRTGSTNTIRVETVGNVIVRGKGVGDKAVSGKTCVCNIVEEARKYFHTGDILVVPETTSEMVPFIKRACALVVGTPEVFDYHHAEITAQVLDIPVIICNERVVEVVPNDLLITVDPVRGYVMNGVPDNG